MNEQSAGEDGPTIERAGRALIEAVPAPAKVILFGPHARGDADDRSDYDFLVIEREIEVRPPSKTTGRPPVGDAGGLGDGQRCSRVSRLALTLGAPVLLVACPTQPDG